MHAGACIFKMQNMNPHLIKEAVNGHRKLSKYNSLAARDSEEWIIKELKEDFENASVDFIIETLNELGHFINIMYADKEYVIVSGVGVSSDSFDSIRDAVWDYLSKQKAVAADIQQAQK